VRGESGNVLGYDTHMERGSPLPDHVHRHVTAARAFHTDLIAHAHRRLRLLMNLAKHLNVLRSRNSLLAEKLSAAESSQQQLETLAQLRRSSREIYRDLSDAVRRIHHHLKRLVTGTRRLRRDELTVSGGARRAAWAGQENSDRTAPSSSKHEPPPRRSGRARPRFHSG
jgi:hypothetical protein